jgi:hypothetical protein
MGERHLIIDHLKFSYEGLFNVAELYNVISSFFFEKGYDWYEKLNQEQITSEGKQIRIVFEPWKNISNYYKLVISIKLNLIDVKDIEVEKEKELLKINQGLVRITFDGYVVSDRFDEWTNQPFYWFLSVIFEKYFFKDNLAKAETWLKNDVDDLHEKIKNYLNVFKYSYHT